MTADRPGDEIAGPPVHPAMLAKLPVKSEEVTADGVVPDREVG